jgi:aspartate/methionine/tyrosine aminotransferase
VIQWSRANNALIVSDECYLEFAHTAAPTSIMSHTGGENTNILAVHSLSKRSNMAGYRAAFVVGDTQVIARLREVRKHAGMIVPLPVQQAMIAALSDDEHVVQQRTRYNSRREILSPALEALGFQIEESRAGLYIWCTRNESDWDSVSFLANCGVLVTPGSFYGEKGARYIRVALTATDEDISSACERLMALKEKS